MTCLIFSSIVNSEYDTIMNESNETLFQKDKPSLHVWNQVHPCHSCCCIQIIRWNCYNLNNTSYPGNKIRVKKSNDPTLARGQGTGWRWASRRNPSFGQVDKLIQQHQPVCVYAVSCVLFLRNIKQK